jgi:transcriptional regulator with XRE-family HTH domain
MNTETFAEKLKRLRESAGLSQPQLAALAGMNRFGVAKLEQGVREPSWATVQTLARALGVTCLAFADDAAPPETRKADPPLARRGRPRKEHPPTEKPTGPKSQTRRKK